MKDLDCLTAYYFVLYIYLARLLLYLDGSVLLSLSSRFRRQSIVKKVMCSLSSRWTVNSNRYLIIRNQFNKDILEKFVIM